jgi:hypothetical protein
MEYVIPVIVLVLAIAGFVTFMVLNATNKSGPVAEGEQGTPGIGPDRTPLGDTTEHAGDQGADGATVDDPETRGRGRTDPDGAAHVARPGEGEGQERLEFEREGPASERLADRDV